MGRSNNEAERDAWKRTAEQMTTYHEASLSGAITQACLDNGMSVPDACETAAVVLPVVATRLRAVEAGQIGRTAREQTLRDAYDAAVRHLAAERAKHEALRAAVAGLADGIAAAPPTSCAPSRRPETGSVPG